MFINYLRIVILFILFIGQVKFVSKITNWVGKNQLSLGNSKKILSLHSQIMKKQMMITAGTIAKLVHGEIFGDPETVVSSITKIEQSKRGSISFYANQKYEKYL